MRDLLNACINVLKSLLEPFSTIIRSAQKLVRALLTMFLEAPVKALETLSKRLFACASNMNTSLDTKSEKKQARTAREDLRTAQERLYYADNFLVHAQQLKRTKVFLIVSLELISFVTTYRGSNQVLSSLHFAVPLIFSLVVQIGLTVLAAAVSRHGTARRQKALLGILLSISILFSYVGAAETLMPYADYAKEQYTAFAHIHSEVYRSAQETTESGTDPLVVLDGEYAKIDQLVSDAQTLYSNDALAAVEKTLEEYQKMTIPVTVQDPIYSYYDENGALHQTGGGTHVIHEPDPDVVPYIKAEQDNVDFIKSQQTVIQDIQSLLAGEGSQTRIRSVMEAQTANPGAILPEFHAACDTMEILAEKCSKLSTAMGSTLSIDLDLYDMLLAYRNANRVFAVGELKSFDTVYDEWRNMEYRPANTGFDLLDDTLALITVNDPAQLKQLVDHSVADGYHSLLSALDSMSHAKERDMLEQAYQSYELMAPINYAVDGLWPSANRFRSAIVAVIFAICNDGLAVAFGLLLEHKKIAWNSNRTLTRTDLMRYLYPQFRTVILPIIKNRLPSDYAFTDLCRAFIDIVADYLDRFTMEPALVADGFTRYLKLPARHDPDFDRFCTFLLTWGLAKSVDAEGAATLGLSVAPDENAQYLLLSSRAEGWLVDLLGNAAELDYDDLLVKA